MTMTAIEHETFHRLTKANDYRCQCDGSPDRAACSRAHAKSGKRCSNGAFVLVMEPTGEMAVICNDCETDRERTARRAERQAKAARAKAYADAQTSIFDLLADQA
jgi:hypothetical protein